MARMNSAPLLFASLCVLAAAPPSAQQTAPSEESAWLGLDQEIHALRSGLGTSEPGGLAVRGFSKLHFALGPDFDAAGGGDLGGFRMRAARLLLQGPINDEMRVNIGIEGTQAGQGQDFRLLDAEIFWEIPDQDMQVLIGLFREPLLHTGFLGIPEQIAIDRTLNGARNIDRRLGAQLYGSLMDGEYEYWLAIQNGLPALENEYRFTVRGAWHVIRSTHDGQMVKAFNGQEGARGTFRQTTLSVGVAAQHDGQDELGQDRDKLAFDIAGTYNNFWGALELVEYQEGEPDSTFDEVLYGAAGTITTPLADTTPFSLTAAYLFGDLEQHEVLARVEDHDDADSTRRTTLGYTFFPQGNPNTRWQLNISRFDSDLASLDGTVVEGGLALRF